MTEISRRIHLEYPVELLHVPIINQLIRRFNLTVNILRAHIDSQVGWIDVQINGPAEALEQAIAWLTEQGIQVTDLTEQA